MPTSQYAIAANTIGQRVSLSPRSAPIPITWPPSKIWNSAAIARKVTAARTTSRLAGSAASMNSPTMPRGADHMISAMPSMKVLPMTSAMVPARSTPGGSPRPAARPTRTVAAWASPSGTMKLTAAHCRAIWCAASCAVLITPIRKPAAGEQPDLHDQRHADRQADPEDLAKPRPVGAPEAAEHLVAAKAPVDQDEARSGPRTGRCC